MLNFTKLEFVALDILVKNYLSWILDAGIHLNAMGLGNTVKVGNDELMQNCTKAMIFFHHHLCNGLKSE